MPKVSENKEILYAYTVKGYKKRLEEIAKTKGTSLTGLINIIVEAYLEEHDLRNRSKLL